HREADAAGRAGWVSALQGGMSESEVAVNFLSSEEYRQAHANTDDYLTGLYADVLGRSTDPEGLESWQRAVTGGWSRAGLADAFLGSEEKSLQFLGHCYDAYLDRGPDADGLAAWLAELQSNRLSPAQVAARVLASDEFFARAAAEVR